MKFSNADKIIYIGADYPVLIGRKGVITKIQQDGSYGITVEMPRDEPDQHLWGVPEKDLEKRTEYVYRWRTADYIHHKVYYTQGAAKGQANSSYRNRRGEPAWVQRAKVDWEDI